MIKRVPVRPVTDDEDYVMEGELNDFLPNEQTVYVDPRTGQTFDSTEKVQLEKLPSTGVLQLPRTTWGG